MRNEMGQYYVAESQNDFSGWEILYIEDFKPGVNKVHIRLLNQTPAQFRVVYCDEKYLPTEFRQVCV